MTMELLSLEQVIEKVKAQDIFHTIGETADSLGYPCYLIGGYVRDLFLNRPTNDVDVMVVGNGIETARALSTRLGREHQPAIYQNFGTAQVKWHGIEIEFVGARRESYDRNSRKPIVEDGTLEDDLNRRDFTINALGICLNADHFGELGDHFEGLYDLEDGIIRTPLDPDITFSDDPLRMMRCIRLPRSSTSSSTTRHSMPWKGTRIALRLSAPSESLRSSTKSCSLPSPRKV